MLRLHRNRTREQRPSTSPLRGYAQDERNMNIRVHAQVQRRHSSSVHCAHEVLQVNQQQVTLPKEHYP